MNLKDYIDGLPSDLQEKARACDNVQDLLALAKQEKVPVPDEALEAIAGGDDAESVNCGKLRCPKCNSENAVCTKNEWYLGYYEFHCNDCGYNWYVDNG